VADELRRQIAIEHGEIAVAVEGFGTLEPLCARCTGALRSDDTEARSDILGCFGRSDRSAQEQSRADPNWCHLRHLFGDTPSEETTD
jgi:hypothetical protein